MDASGYVLQKLREDAEFALFRGQRPGDPAAVLLLVPTLRQPRVRIALKRLDGGRVSLVVSDDGIGFPEGTDPYAPETLGLQLVHDLSQQLHGSLAFQSNGGTAVTISFGAGDRGRPT